MVVTKAGDRVTIELGRGAWTREITWSMVGDRCTDCDGSGDDPPAYWNGYEDPTCKVCDGAGVTKVSAMMSDLADDGACIRYTLTMVPIPPRDEFSIASTSFHLEAHIEGSQHHGNYPVIVVARWSTSVTDLLEIQEQASQSIRVSHHWVAAMLQLSSPMSRFDALQLNLDDMDHSIACLACPALSLVKP